MDFTNLPSADGEHDYQIEQRARLRERARREEAADDDFATSLDGAVSVVVGAGGILNDITFHPKAAELSHLELRTSVMAAYHLGCQRADVGKADEPLP